MLTYDPSNPAHRKVKAAEIKGAWLQEVMQGASAHGQGGAPANADQLAAKYAKQWADAGLNPHSPDAPQAPAGVKPPEAPEPQTFEPVVYSGPSVAEIDAELEGLATANITETTLARKRELSQLRAGAVRAGHWRSDS